MTETRIKWILRVDFDSMDAAFKKHIGSEQHAYKSDFVEIVSAMDEDEKNMASIEWPTKDCPQLTKELFLKLAMTALPLNKHPEWCFAVTMDAQNGDGNIFAHFESSFSEFFDRKEIGGNFWFKEEEASKTLADQLAQVRRIVNKGVEDGSAW